MTPGLPLISESWEEAEYGKSSPIEPIVVENMQRYRLEAILRKILTRVA